MSSERCFRGAYIWVVCFFLKTPDKFSEPPPPLGVDKMQQGRQNFVPKWSASSWVGNSFKRIFVPWGSSLWASTWITNLFVIFFGTRRVGDPRTGRTFSEGQKKGHESLLFLTENTEENGPTNLKKNPPAARRIIFRLRLWFMRVLTVVWFHSEDKNDRKTFLSHRWGIFHKNKL